MKGKIVASEFALKAKRFFFLFQKDQKIKRRVQGEHHFSMQIFFYLLLSFVLAQAASVWDDVVERHYIKQEDGGSLENDRFGEWVAIDNGVVAVSALYEDSCATGVNETHVGTDNACSSATYGPGAAFTYERVPVREK